MIGQSNGNGIIVVYIVVIIIHLRGSPGASNYMPLCSATSRCLVVAANYCLEMYHNL